MSFSFKKLTSGEKAGAVGTLWLFTLIGAAYLVSGAAGTSAEVLRAFLPGQVYRFKTGQKLVRIDAVNKGMVTFTDFMPIQGGDPTQNVISQSELSAAFNRGELQVVCG